MWISNRINEKYNFKEFLSWESLLYFVICMYILINLISVDCKYK